MFACGEHLGLVLPLLPRTAGVVAHDGVRRRPDAPRAGGRCTSVARPGAAARAALVRQSLGEEEEEEEEDNGPFDSRASGPPSLANAPRSTGRLRGKVLLNVYFIFC